MVNDPEFPPPIGYLCTLVNVGLDPVTCDICDGGWQALWLNPLLRPFHFSEWGTAGFWRQRTTQSINPLGWFLWFGSFLIFLEGAVASGASSSSSSSPRRVPFSSRVEEVLGLSPVGSRRDASIIYSPLRLIIEPCTSGVPTPHCRGPQLVVLTSLHNTGVLGLRQGSSPASWSGSPSLLGHQHGAENHEYTAHKIGGRIPLTQCLLLCEGQPEGHSLPLRKVQGHSFTG